MKHKNVIAYAITAAVVFSSLFSFLALSPFSLQNFSNGTLNQEMNYSTIEKELNHMYSLVPKNSIVFIQNDMPQLSDAKKIYMPGFGTYRNQTVDYAIINPIGFNPITKAFGGFSEKWAYYFSTNYSYGVYASVEGAVLYKLGYHGRPVYYVPVEMSTQVQRTISLQNNSSNFGGLGLIIPPGNYEVTYVLTGQLNLSHESYVSDMWNGSGILTVSQVPLISIEPSRYVLAENFSVPYYGWWSFSLLGWSNICEKVTLETANISEENPL